MAADFAALFNTLPGTDAILSLAATVSSASTASLTKVKSRVWLPSPTMVSGSPACSCARNTPVSEPTTLAWRKKYCMNRSTALLPGRSEKFMRVATSR